MGPLCFFSSLVISPALDHTRTWPSYEPVASNVPSGFHPSVVTSLLFSFDLLLQCSSTMGSRQLACASGPHGPGFASHIRAVESPDPDASMDVVGFQAQTNTSDWWPSRMLTCEAGISTGRSSSMAFAPPLLSRPCCTDDCCSSCCSCTFCFSISMSFVSRSMGVRHEKSPCMTVPSSFRLASSSRYCSPFWMNDISAPGGTSSPLIWVLLTKLS
mmetsp:Transcript_31154/g.80489  ORF Transcript_31154/g.80489 Transcript_31154/m.80489 type:complete len:215 (-) Transcript_31154:542-1186(-)